MLILFETFYRYYKFAKRLYAQFSLIRRHLVGIGDRHRN
jgi:hypothetical protein